MGARASRLGRGAAVVGSSIDGPTSAGRVRDPAMATPDHTPEAAQMRARMTWLPTLALLLVIPCMARGAATTEEPIGASAKVKALPAVVRQTVLAEGKGAMVRNVLTEKGGDGAVVYEIEMKVKGLAKDIVVGADGKLLVSEQQMTMAALPPAVRATIVKNTAGRRIKMVESVTKVGKLEYYEAHVVSGKTVTEIMVTPDGALLPPE